MPLIAVAPLVYFAASVAVVAVAVDFAAAVVAAAVAAVYIAAATVLPFDFEACC